MCSSDLSSRSDRDAALIRDAAEALGPSQHDEHVEDARRGGAAGQRRAERLGDFAEFDAERLRRLPDSGFGRGGGAGGVTPGTYNVTLTVNGKSYSKPVTVLADIWRGDK